MANRPLQYVLSERKLNVGKNAGKVVQVALPTGRQRIDFERFCELVAKDTTLNYMEVESVLNLAADLAKDLVSNGDIVEYGRLGTLIPSFKSKAVVAGEKFNANIHIEKPVVLLQPSKKYFTLTNVSFEQTEAKLKESKKQTKPSSSTSQPAPTAPRSGSADREL